LTKISNFNVKPMYNFNS